jgi:hypothetical protein
MAVLQPHLSESFQFPPSASAELLLKPHNITNATPDGYSFTSLYFSDYLKIHLKFHLQIYFDIISTYLSSDHQAAYDSAYYISIKPSWGNMPRSINISSEWVVSSVLNESTKGRQQLPGVGLFSQPLFY